MRGLRIHGELKDLDVTEVLHSLWRSSETGVFSLAAGELERSLYFKAGRIVFATSQDPEDRLGAWLLRRGLLGFAAERELAARVEPGRRFGALAVERGLLAPEQLVECVQAQLGAIVARVVASRRGSYSFTFGDPPLREMIVLQQSTPGQLLAAVRQLEQLDRVVAAVGPGEAAWRATGGPADDLVLSQGETGLLARLGERQRFEQLAAQTGVSEFELARSLWGLRLAGLVAREADAGVAGQRPGMVAQAPPDRDASTRVETAEPRSAPEPASADESPPASAAAEHQERVSLFNDKHAYLYRILKVELGAGVEAFLRACVRRSGEQTRELLSGLELDASGRWDVAALARALEGCDGELADRLLRQLLDTETQALVRLTGHDRGGLILDGLRMIEQRRTPGDPLSEPRAKR